MRQLVERYPGRVLRVDAPLREAQLRDRGRGRFRRLGGFRRILRRFLRAFFRLRRCRIRRDRGRAASAEHGQHQDGQDDEQDGLFHKRFPLFSLNCFYVSFSACRNLTSYYIIHLPPLQQKTASRQIFINLLDSAALRIIPAWGIMSASFLNPERRTLL